MQDVETAGTPRIVTSVLVAVRWTPTVERVTLTVRNTAWIFISKGGTVGGAVLTQWVFTAWTSWVFSGKEGAVNSTKNVERVGRAVRRAPGIFAAEI